MQTKDKWKKMNGQLRKLSDLRHENFYIENKTTCHENIMCCLNRENNNSWNDRCNRGSTNFDEREVQHVHLPFIKFRKHRTVERRN